MGGIIFDITANDNRLAITTDKQMDFRKTFVSRKVCDYFLINNENCCKGQHISGISNAAAVKNRGYFWQGVVALCESFPGVN